MTQLADLPVSGAAIANAINDYSQNLLATATDGGEVASVWLSFNSLVRFYVSSDYTASTYAVVCQRCGFTMNTRTIFATDSLASDIAAIEQVAMLARHFACEDNTPTERLEK